jgi:hypothetical protein
MDPPLHNFANWRGLSWINIYLKFLFGTEALNDKPSVEADPQVQRIEASMVEVASSTKDYIVEHMEASEK